MDSFLVVIPLVLVLVTLLYSVLYAMLQAWLDYRVRMALLNKLDQNPRILDGEGQLSKVLTAPDSLERTPSRQDFLITGLMIASIGIGCIIFGRFLRVGDLAVGTYLGGFLCLLIGVVVCVLGGVVKVFSRDPTARLTRK